MRTIQYLTLRTVWLALQESFAIGVTMGIPLKQFEGNIVINDSYYLSLEQRYNRDGEQAQELKF